MDGERERARERKRERKNERHGFLFVQEFPLIPPFVKMCVSESDWVELCDVDRFSAIYYLRAGDRQFIESNVKTVRPRRLAERRALLPESPPPPQPNQKCQLTTPTSPPQQFAVILGSLREDNVIR